MRSLVCVVAGLLVTSSPSAAQELRTLSLERISDSARRAALRTSADTARLLKLMLPVALDSLRADTMPGALWSYVSDYPQFRLGEQLRASVDTLWLAELLRSRGFAGICSPTIRGCRRGVALALTVADEPGEGDDAVRLVFSLRAGAESRPAPRTIDVRNENDEHVRYWEIGILQGAPLWPLTGHYMPLPPSPYLLVVRIGSDWRQTKWVD